MNRLTVIENTVAADVFTTSKIYPTAIAPTTPEVRVHVVHRSEDTGHTAGVWALTDDDGTVTTLRAGDTALLRKGWKGTGEVVETAHKAYATFL